GPAAEVRRERLRECGPLRADLIGVSSLFGDDAGRWLDALPAGSARDVRLRVALRHEERAVAEKLVREVTALYTCGPAGGGGVRTACKPTLGTLSCLLPRELITATYEMLDDVLDGGVNDALNLDGHGKALSFLLLDLPLVLPAALAPLLRGPDH